MQSSKHHQLSLKSLLLIAFYLSVGLIASVKPGAETVSSAFSRNFAWAWLIFEIALYSIASALAVGLTMQVLSLSKLQPPSDARERVSLRLAIGWRLVVATALFGSLLFRIAITQGWVTHPRKWNDHPYFGTYGAAIPDALTNLGILAGVFLNQASPRHYGGWRSHPIARYVWALFCLVIAIAALTEFMLGPYYTYKAFAGIEHYHKPQFWRPGAYLDPKATGYCFFWIACGAMTSLLAGAALLFRAIANSKQRVLRGVLGTVFVSISAAYGYWFFISGGPTLAPDFAEAGLQGHWWHWVEAAIVLGVFIPLVAYRMSQVTSVLGDVEVIDTPLQFPLSLPVIALGTVGCLCGVTDIVPAYFDNSVYAQPFAQHLKALLTDLNVYLPVALTLVFIRLLWMGGFRGRDLQQPIPVIDAHRFAWTCALLIVLIPVAIPTITAFGFSMWLSPWLSF